MADIAYRNEGLVRRTDWGAIWAGVFTFMAIWAVFGALGFAIFASAASPTAARPVLGMSVGIGIWMIVLTAIAMYVAGRETGRFAAVTTRHDGLIHGMIMFGLSFVGVLVLVALGSFSTGGTRAGTAGQGVTPYVLTVFTDLGWIGFFALILGWLGAMFGASSGASQRAERTVPREIRPAA
jgi:hypothetical protein